MSHTIDFFDEQFRRQVQEGEFALNPFERLALEHLRGSVLDLGCGLGNLSLEAARRGCPVLAVDGSVTVIERLRQAASAQGLPLEALQVDLKTWSPVTCYDTVIAIGILMFFPRVRALALLNDVLEKLEPRGLAVINVLTEGTTFMQMFDLGSYYLFGRDELLEHFPGWELLVWRHDGFAAPGDTIKQFATLIARKPA